MKDVCKNPSSKQYQIFQSEIKETGIIPVVSQSANYIEGYSNNHNRIYKIDNPILIFGDHTLNLKYIDFDFLVGGDGVKIIEPLFFPLYAYFSILYIIENMRNRGYARHYATLSNSIIPLPPYKEQLRIVAKIEELFSVLDEIQKSIEA